MENSMFWSEIGSGFGEPRGTHPPRILRSTPPLPPPPRALREPRMKAGELSEKGLSLLVPLKRCLNISPQFTNGEPLFGFLRRYYISERFYLYSLRWVMTLLGICDDIQKAAKMSATWDLTKNSNYLGKCGN